MLLPDVNVLVYAFCPDSPRHVEYQRWLDETINGSAAYGISDLVLSGFVRIVTHPRVFEYPASADKALSFATVLRSQPHCVHVVPGERHWAIFADLCRRVQAKGNLVLDAFIAALAIENGCELITADRDFARFPGLRWRHPLEA